jgi:hypothetical protein
MIIYLIPWLREHGAYVFPKNLGGSSGWSIVRDFSALKGNLQQIS